MRCCSIAGSESRNQVEAVNVPRKMGMATMTTNRILFFKKPKMRPNFFGGSRTWNLERFRGSTGTENFQHLDQNFIQIRVKIVARKTRALVAICTSRSPSRSGFSLSSRLHQTSSNLYLNGKFWKENISC